MSPASTTSTVPGGPAPRARVDEDDVVRSLPRREQPPGVAVTLADFEAASFARSQTPGDLSPRTVVAASGVPDADDPNHPSTISSLRKCAEQEMQGS